MSYATAIWSPPVFLLSLLLTACPEAPPTTDAPMPNNPPQAGADGTMPPPPPQDGAAGGGAPGAGPATMPSLTVEPGTGVKLSGEFKYSGTAQGKNRVDFFQVGADGRPMILHAMTIDKAGPWEIELPKALGKINLLAFIDAEGNGPQLAEPSVLLKDVDVEQAPISGLTLTLADGAANEFATDSTTMLNPTVTNPPPNPGSEGPPGAGATGVPVPADGAPIEGAAPAAPVPGAAGAPAAGAAPAGAPAAGAAAAAPAAGATEKPKVK